MFSQALEIRCQSAPWMASVQFMLRERHHGKLAVVTDMVLTDVEPGHIIKPSFELEYSAAQTLMDDLWQAGLRPTEGTGSAGALRAVERHLEDMRTLVFKPSPPAG